MNLEGIIQEETSKWFGFELASEVDDLAEAIRAEGYIKIDVDVEALRSLMRDLNNHRGEMYGCVDCYRKGTHVCPLGRARTWVIQVLAAFDREGEA